MSDTIVTETTPEPAEPMMQESYQQKEKLPKHLLFFFLGGFILSFAIDFLFWQKPFGYSYAIWVGLILVVSLLLTWKEKKKIHPEGYFLIAAMVATTAAAVWRMEEGTRGFNTIASLILIALTCDTLITGGALRFRVIDAILRMILVVFAAFERPIQALIAMGQNKKTNGNPGTWKRKIAPVMRGILIAIPILLVFSVLFSSADPIFEKALKDFFEWLKIDDWVEFLWRGIYILMLGVLFSGALIHALSGKRNYAPKEEGIKLSFLGKTESFTILILIETLFAVFVFIQFRYLFGGGSNINLAGYTFAEYARKGTNELIAVAILALLVYQALHAVTKMPEKQDRRILHILMTILFAEVLIILLSSYQRLDLYQLVYGFTRIRVRTYIFISWLAALLLLVVVIEWLGQSKRFFAVLLFICLGFVLSQAAVNIDQFVVEHNLARLDQELPDVAWKGLDHYYLGSLSEDAVPAMLKAVESNAYDALTTEMLRAELYCRQRNLLLYHEENTDPWFSQNPSRQNAYTLLKGEKNLLSPDSTFIDEGDEYYGSSVIKLSNGEDHYCGNDWRYDGW